MKGKPEQKMSAGIQQTIFKVKGIHSLYILHEMLRVLLLFTAPA